MQGIKLAVATVGDKGVEDVVSEVFGRARTFTIIEVTAERSISRVEVMKNPAITYKHGAGPIVVKMLVDKGVTVVAAREFGPGAEALLEQHNVKRLKIKPGSTVNQVVNKVLNSL